MYYCPRCRAEVSAEALFCKKCGLNRPEPPAPSTLPTLVSPQTGSSLIHPVGVRTSQQPLTNPVISSSTPVEIGLPNSTFSPQFTPSTPAHLLALKPVTPPSIPQVQTQKPKSPQQFMRPTIMPAPPVEQSLPLKQHSPLLNTPTARLPVEIVKGRPPLIQADEHFSIEDDNAESYIATSVAAEHWRTSWRNRQRKEAGPATLVSRGQSPVQEPLMAMQNSLARMRAVILPQKSRINLRFWLIMLLMFCLIAGLVAFIASTFQTKAELAGQSFHPTDIPPPSLSILGRQAVTVAQGQTLTLRGEHFDAGAPILFLLDGTLPINGTGGRQLALLASDQGSFDAAVRVTSSWSAGPHVIDANNNKNSQSAYLNVIVSLAGSVPTSNPNLALSAHAITFHAIVGQDNPQEQFVTLTNTNANSPVQWVARAVADDDLTWLDVDDTTTGGKLGIGGTGTVGIRASIEGLTNITGPYTGHIIFTIDQREQLTLPVKLQLAGGTPEVAINPNPLIGVLSSTGDGCLSGTTLLLTNLSSEPVSWSLSLDPIAAAHIQFLSAGKSYTQGILAASGQQEDSKTLMLHCIQVQSGDTYHFTLHSGELSWPAEITIQTTP